MSLLLNWSKYLCNPEGTICKLNRNNDTHIIYNTTSIATWAHSSQLKEQNTEATTGLGEKYVLLGQTVNKIIQHLHLSVQPSMTEGLNYQHLQAKQVFFGSVSNFIKISALTPLLLNE